MNRGDLRLLPMPNGEFLAFWPRDPESVALIPYLHRPRRLIPRIALRILSSWVVPAVGGRSTAVRSECGELLEAVAALLGEDQCPCAFNFSGDSTRAALAVREQSGRVVFVKARSDGNPMLGELVAFSSEFAPICPEDIVIPQVHRSGKVGRWEMVVLSDADARHGARRDETLEELIPYLVELCSVTTVTRTAGEALDELMAALNEVPADTAALIAVLREQWEQGDVALCRAHGDFSPWNMRIVDGTLHIWDWGKSIREAPWPYDAIHHCMQVRRYFNGQGYKEALDGTLGDFARYAPQLGLPSTERDALLSVAAYLAWRSIHEHRLDRVSGDGQWMVTEMLRRLG